MFRPLAFLAAALLASLAQAQITATQSPVLVRVDLKSAAAVSSWTIEPSAAVRVISPTTAVADLAPGKYLVRANTTADGGFFLTLTVSGVAPVPVPKITVTATPATIQVGQYSKLAHHIEGATDGKLDGVLIPKDGETIVTPTKTTEYVYTAPATNPTATTKTTVTVGDPKPPDPPKPEPDPPPLPVTGLHVAIFEESADRSKLPATTREVLLGTGAGSVREWLTKNCAKDAKGNPQFRILDASAEPAKDDKVWADAWKRPRQGLPWVVIGNSKSGFEGPLPGTPSEVLELLKKYGG